MNDLLEAIVRLGCLRWDQFDTRKNNLSNYPLRLPPPLSRIRTCLVPPEVKTVSLWIGTYNVEVNSMNFLLPLLSLSLSLSFFFA